MQQPQRVSVCPGVKAIIDPEGSVLLDIPRGRYYSLNAVGAQIWQGLEQGLSAEEIEGQLLDAYRADQDRVREDVARFLALLTESRLIAWN